MSEKQVYNEQNRFSLKFKDNALEEEFKKFYDDDIKLPLRFGIIISLLSWYSGLSMAYLLIPEKANELSLITFLVISSYFGFIIYATYKKRFKGYYHLLGAISNAWAGLYAIYYCDQFPDGAQYILPVLIFIMFFGAYLVRLKWMAGMIAAFSYMITFHIYLIQFSGLSSGQVLFYSFVAWMTFMFALLATRIAEDKNRFAFIQERRIAEQNKIIRNEKEFLLQEVHHRVKNNLQVILSLIKLQRSKQGNELSNSELKEIQSRVLSMSAVHQFMKKTTESNHIYVHELLSELISNIDYLYGLDKIEKNIEVDEVIKIDIETAIPFGLIVNEMITGFLKENSAGGSKSFSISLEKQNEDEYQLSYKDNGVGVHIGDDKEPTLNIELIEALTAQLNGKFNYLSNEGSEFEVTICLN